MSKKWFVACGVISIVCISLCSCFGGDREPLFHGYEVQSVHVKNNAITQLDNDCRDIKIETYLSLRDSIFTLMCQRMKVEDGYYFLQGSGKNQTIWVFDSVGNYVSKLGERGRKNNEYQTDVTDWFYLKDSNEVYVFERNTRKIHVFSVDGSSKETIILESWPNAIGALKKNDLFCSYYHKQAKDGAQLALLSKDEEVKKIFINLQENMKFQATDNSFFSSCGKLFHVPNFADSAIVFNRDSVEKVVRFSFEDKFITKEIKKEIYDGKMENFFQFDGVQSINTYYETTRFHYLKYMFSGICINHLIDKRTNNQYKFANSLVKGILPSDVFCVKDNKLLYLVTKQKVEEYRHLLDDDTLAEELSESDDVVRRIFNGEEPLPLILSVEIK